jgi:hypothetical protein
VGDAEITSVVYAIEEDVARELVTRDRVQEGLLESTEWVVVARKRRTITGTPDGVGLVERVPGHIRDITSTALRVTSGTQESTQVTRDAMTGTRGAGHSGINAKGHGKTGGSG